jgi:hypothetical protein
VAIRFETAAWVVQSLSAATEKFRNRATQTKVSRNLRFKSEPLRVMARREPAPPALT